MAKQKQAVSKPKKTTATKPYVKRDTIWKSVGGGLSNPGQSKICKVGQHKVLLTRADKLDRYGNPVHTATVINKDGSLGESYRSNGDAAIVVSEALKKSGIETRYPTQKPKVKK